MPGVRFPVSEFFLFGFSEKVTSKGFLKTVQSVRYGVVGNISACHADARGSIPRFGVLFFFFSRVTTFFNNEYLFPEIAFDTLPEWLRGSPAK